MKTFRALAVTIMIVASSSVLAQSADLVVSVTAPESGPEGALLRWTATVTNLGPDPAEDVVLHNSLNFKTVSCEPVASLPRLASGATLLVTCSAVLAVVSNADYSQQVIASVDSSTFDPDNANDSDRVTVRVITAPDLTIFSDVRNLAVDPELPYAITVQVQNGAWTTAERVIATIHFAPGTSFSSLPEGCTSSDGVVTCELGSVDPFPHVRRIVIQPVAPAQSAAMTIPFSLTVESNVEDRHPDSNSFSGEIRLFRTFYVTATSDEGEGSLRAAIHSVNAACDEHPCKIAFRIPISPALQWQTLRPASSLPEITAAQVSIDGTTQTRFFGDTNESGPEIEVTGTDTGEFSDGLVLRSRCGAEVRGLTINGFAGSGVRYDAEGCERSVLRFILSGVSESHLGCDPTGMVAVPNRWGVFVSAPDFRIANNIIGGNIRSGVFVTDNSDRFVINSAVEVTGNRIGIKRDLSGPLSNGASGVYFDTRVNGGDVSQNYIGFNEHFGIGIASGARAVSIRGNSIQANWQQGIDFGLDGVTAVIPADLPTPAIHLPTITSARWDPITETTIIEGTLTMPVPNELNRWIISVYANDAVDQSGHGEGQYFLGESWVEDGRFSFVFDGDLRAKWVAATTTNVRPRALFAKPSLQPQAIDEFRYLLTTTSEFSHAVQVSP